jgi:hypothetical protein
MLILLSSEYFFKGIVLNYLNSRNFYVLILGNDPSTGNFICSVCAFIVKNLRSRV